jgi:hypothetical protein
MIDLRPAKPTLGGGIAKSFFLLWGFAGLFISIVAMFFAPIMSAIYVTLMWTGGVLFFGLSVLMSGRSYSLGPALPVYVVATPRLDGLDEEYEGIPFMRLESGHIIAEFSNGKFTFENWNKFAKAAQLTNLSPK